MVYSWVSTAPSVPMVLNLHPKLILQLRQVSAVVKAVGAGYISWAWNRSDKVGEQWVSLVDCFPRLFLTINGQSTGSGWRRPASAATAPRPWQWAASRRRSRTPGCPSIGMTCLPQSDHWVLTARETLKLMTMSWCETWRSCCHIGEICNVRPSYFSPHKLTADIYLLIEKYVWCAVVVRGQVT